MNSSSKQDATPVVIYHDYKKLISPESEIISVGTKIYTNEKVSTVKKTHVILCSDYAIKKLNTSFRGNHRPTDVLSFNYYDEDLLGEIYISLQRAKAQAKDYGFTYKEEVTRLFVHGMFHLLGMDHEKIEDRTKMEKKEAKYF